MQTRIYQREWATTSAARSRRNMPSSARAGAARSRYRARARARRGKIPSYRCKLAIATKHSFERAFPESSDIDDTEFARKRVDDFFFIDRLYLHGETVCRWLFL